MVKGSEVMQIVFSMKSRVEIMAIHYCMLELVFFKVPSHTDTARVAEDASESAFISDWKSAKLCVHVHYGWCEVMTSGF